MTFFIKIENFMVEVGVEYVVKNRSDFHKIIFSSNGKNTDPSNFQFQKIVNRHSNDILLFGDWYSIIRLFVTLHSGFDHVFQTCLSFVTLSGLEY